jgi:hypothetical protein
MRWRSLSFAESSMRLIVPYSVVAESMAQFTALLVPIYY